MRARGLSIGIARLNWNLGFGCEHRAARLLIYRHRRRRRCFCPFWWYILSPWWGPAARVYIALQPTNAAAASPHIYKHACFSLALINRKHTLALLFLINRLVIYFPLSPTKWVNYTWIIRDASYKRNIYISPLAIARINTSAKYIVGTVNVDRRPFIIIIIILTVWPTKYSRLHFALYIYPKPHLQRELMFTVRPSHCCLNLVSPPPLFCFTNNGQLVFGFVGSDLLFFFYAIYM